MKQQVTRSKWLITRDDLCREKHERRLLNVQYIQLFHSLNKEREHYNKKQKAEKFLEQTYGKIIGIDRERKDLNGTLREKES